MKTCHFGIPSCLKLALKLFSPASLPGKPIPKGQHTIPSDTVCYPAKLMHGHIELLLEKGVHTIFYPCMTYNFDEFSGDNHYNCPVVAYYPELLKANITALDERSISLPLFFALSDQKQFTKRVSSYFKKIF
jgi:predicted nucleotide-binding protein (sugar kinase/HSP70/actin superfamily)